LEQPFLLPKPFDEKDVFWQMSGPMSGNTDAKNEAGILTEPMRGAQFGKLSAGWQNAYRLQII
jgi:hypothetical protein